MEETLKNFYLKDERSIFQEKYHLFDKLLNLSKTPEFVQDAIIINKIITGNKFYSVVSEYHRQNKMIMDEIVYNAFINQLYSHDQLWESFNYERAEILFRHMLTLCGIDVTGISRIIQIENVLKITEKEKKEEYEYAYLFYLKQQYKEALELLLKLFYNGAHNAAGLLGLMYYKGAGTMKNYNKALYYLSYPQIRDRNLIKQETDALKELIELKYKTQMQCILCTVVSVISFLFMMLCGFFQSNMILAITYTVIIVLACTGFSFVYLKKYIFDFSFWYLVAGSMFLSILIL